MSQLYATKMSKKSSVVARRAWSFLRLALLWARKGGLFRNRVAISFHIFQKVIRKLLVHSNQSRRALLYGDREFSFNDTPIIHVKMHRPSSSLRFHFPCIKPQADFDCDFGEDDLISEEEDHEIMWCEEYDQAHSTKEEITNEDCEEGIDVKAEKFIANFYEQMKLQRQMSYL